MTSVFAIVTRLTPALGLALLVPVVGSATPGTFPAGNCTSHSGTTLFPIKLTVDNQGIPSVDPATNENGTCVQGGDTVSVDASSLPPGSSWWFGFAQNVSLFRNGCQLGNGSGKQSTCQVVSYPGALTYEYKVTVGANSIDPKIIVKGSGAPARNGSLNRSSDRQSLAAATSSQKLRR